MLVGITASAACTRRASTEPAVTGSTPAAQQAAAPDPTKDVAYVCPMDRDVRSNAPGKCPRCGMALVAGIPEPAEFHLDLSVSPEPPLPGRAAQLTFAVFDPWKGNPVRKFSVVHENLFHAFIVSRDLQFFAHVHPVYDNGVFRENLTFPRPGMYRVLGDFYPEAATPQLLTQTVFVPGAESAPVPFGRDYSTKTAENVKVAVVVSPADPVAGVLTQMRFVLSPSDGIERYLGAWGHMLAVSDDLIDMIHTHPSLANGSPEMQFNLVFPRPRTYRLWVQFQRSGVVDTARFDVPIKRLEPVTTN